jgi:hypothetical protein
VERQNHFGQRRENPIVHRDVIIVAGRVVSVQTRHVGEAYWVAVGYVSESLPTGKWLGSPDCLTATGRTEAQAIDALKQLIKYSKEGHYEGDE